MQRPNRNVKNSTDSDGEAGKQRLYGIRVTLLLVNVVVVVAAGLVGAIALAFAWETWRLSGRRELAVLVCGGVGLLLAAGFQRGALRWVWLAADFAALIVGFYALFAKDQQLVQAVGFQPFAWVTYVILPPTTFLLMTMFKRIDPDFRWVRDPAVLGPK